MSALDRDEGGPVRSADGERGFRGGVGVQEEKEGRRSTGRWSGGRMGLIREGRTAVGRGEASVCPRADSG